MRRTDYIIGFWRGPWALLIALLAFALFRPEEIKVEAKQPPAPPASDVPAPAPAEPRPVATKTADAVFGVASYYADKFHGHTTASGETFDMFQLTAAHRNYKFGTRVRVTHLGNNRSVIVRINDRGPFVAGRIIDLSLAAAEELQMVKSGLAEVKLEVLN